MNQPLPDDGVSAFFDEELSPSEEREVRRHLSQSPDAQSELAQIRRLSEELRCLDKEVSPRNLVGDVMNQVDGKAAFPTNSLSQRVLTAGKWLAGLAALVLAAVWIPSLWERDDNPDTNDTIASNTESAKDALPGRIGDPVPPSSIEQPAQRKPQSKSSDQVTSPAGAELMQSANDEVAAQPLERGAPTAPQPVPEVAVAKDTGDADDGSNANGQLADQLSREVLDLAKRGQGEVVVVEVTAADARKAFADLQQLLAEENVSRSPARRKLPGGDQAAGAAVADESQASRGLYVQSTDKQIEAALAKLAEKQPGLKFQPQTAQAFNKMAAGGFGGGGNARFGGLSTGGRPSRSNSPTGPQAVNPAAEPTDAKKPGEKAPSDRPRPGFADGQRAIRSLESQSKNAPVKKMEAESGDSFQFPIPLSQVVPLHREPDREGDKAKERAKEARAGDGAELKTMKKAEDAKRANPAPVRIMFIFRQAAPAPPKSR